MPDVHVLDTLIHSEIISYFFNQWINQLINMSISKVMKVSKSNEIKFSFTISTQKGFFLNHFPSLRQGYHLLLVYVIRLEWLWGRAAWWVWNDQWVWKTLCRWPVTVFDIARKDLPIGVDGCHLDASIATTLPPLCYASLVGDGLLVSSHTTA